jgi:hypothetical protein
MGDFNNHFQPIDRPPRPKKKKINRDTSELNSNVDQMDLTDSHRILHSKASEYTFLSAAHEIFSQLIIF